MADQGGDNIVIHTMRDDLAAGSGSQKSAPLPPPAKPAPPQPPKFQTPIPAPKLTPAPKPSQQIPPKPQFPLPPRNPVAAPAPPPAFIPRRRQRGKLVWALALLFVLVLAAAGAYAYFFLLATPSEVLPPEVEVAQLSDIIPASATVVAHYRVETPDTRGQLLEVWQSSVKPLLQGNPSSLLTQGNLTEFAFVMLEANTRPFLVVPKDSLPADIKASLNDLQLAEVSGWQVLHSMRAQDYAQALASGKRALTPPAAVSAAGLQVHVNQAALNQLRSHIASPSFGAGLLHSLSLTLSPAVSTRALVVSGHADSASPLPPAATLVPRADQALLEQIPADATFVRLGASLKQDVASWQTVAKILDAEVLAVPAVAALVTQLDTPYAYYHRSGPDGINDVGLIVSLPDSLTPSLALGDATLEQALTALLPLITSGKPVATLRFADGVYQSTSLRFVNIAGANEALDYALSASHLQVSTSKEGMFALLDSTAARTPSFAAAAPWQSVLSEWQTVPETEHLFFGSLTYAPLLELLPTDLNELPFGLAFNAAARPADAGATGRTISGSLIVAP